MDASRYHGKLSGVPGRIRAGAEEWTGPQVHAAMRAAHHAGRYGSAALPTVQEIREALLAVGLRLVGKGAAARLVPASPAIGGGT